MNNIFFFCSPMETKNRKNLIYDYSFVSAHCASFMYRWPLLRREGLHSLSCDRAEKIKCLRLRKSLPQILETWIVFRSESGALITTPILIEGRAVTTPKKRGCHFFYRQNLLLFFLLIFSLPTWIVPCMTTRIICT